LHNIQNAGAKRQIPDTAKAVLKKAGRFQPQALVGPGRQRVVVGIALQEQVIAP
jgi:hypothetical protein